MLQYESVRDPASGENLALLSCRPFASREPTERQTWRVQLSASGARVVCAFPERQLEYGRDAFAADARIAALAWERSG